MHSPSPFEPPSTQVRVRTLPVFAQRFPYLVAAEGWHGGYCMIFVSRGAMRGRDEAHLAKLTKGERGRTPSLFASLAEGAHAGLRRLGGREKIDYEQN